MRQSSFLPKASLVYRKRFLGNARLKPSREGFDDNLLRHLFAVPARLWNSDKSNREQPFEDEHARFMDLLFEAGVVILGGPFVDGTGSMVIVTADNVAQVYEMFRTAPVDRA